MNMIIISLLIILLVFVIYFFIKKETFEDDNPYGLPQTILQIINRDDSNFETNYNKNIDDFYLQKIKTVIKFNKK